MIDNGDVDKMSTKMSTKMFTKISAKMSTKISAKMSTINICYSNTLFLSAKSPQSYETSPA